MARKNILIIDDEKGFCELIKDNLEMRGPYTVNMAHNGEDGLWMARKLKPDLILLDIRMPQMNGFQVLEGLKKEMETVEIPVVMLSALDDEESKIKSAQLYDEMYLTKPVKMPELQTKIEEVLVRKG